MRENSALGIVRFNCYFIFSAVLILILIRFIASRTIHLYDDAYITFRYAENLARGNGFIYNIGEKTLGLTGPLYGLLLAAFNYLGIRLQIFVNILNITADALILFFTLKLLIKSNYKLAAYCFAFLFTISPLMNRITVGGMEMNMFLLLSLAAIYSYNTQRKFLSVAVATMAYFLRPEGALLVLILIIYEFISNSKMISFKMIIISLSILIIPFIIIFSFYGSIFPQSVISKTGYHDDLWYLIKGWLFSDFIFVAAFPLAIWGGILYFKKNQLLQILIIWGSLYAIANFVMRQKIFTWYPYPVHYVQLLIAAFGAAHLLSRFKLPAKINLAAVFPVYMGFGEMLLWVFVLIFKGSNPVQHNVYNPLQKWCIENQVNNKTFLASDIGIIGYFSKSRIYDSEDLVTQNTMNYRQTDGKINGKMIENIKPDYIFLNLRSGYVELIRKFDTLYKPLVRFSEQGKKDLYPKPEEFGDFWHPDYIVYKRLK